MPPSQRAPRHAAGAFAMKPIAVAAISLPVPEHGLAGFDQIEIKPVAAVQN
jgi:hypothetical protein